MEYWVLFWYNYILVHFLTKILSNYVLLHTFLKQAASFIWSSSLLFPKPDSKYIGQIQLNKKNSITKPRNGTCMLHKTKPFWNRALSMPSFRCQWLFKRWHHTLIYYPPKSLNSRLFSQWCLHFKVLLGDESTQTERWTFKAYSI